MQPGKAYEFSVWVKTEDIEGTDTGATICLEWYGEGNQYLGGNYPAGRKGTQDWQQITSVSGRVPAEARHCYVICYVRQKMTGKAWWDEVVVKRHLAPPLQTMLLRPNYRGLVTPSRSRIEVAATLTLDDYDLQPEDVELRFWLSPHGEKAVDGQGRPACASSSPAVKRRG